MIAARRGENDLNAVKQKRPVGEFGQRIVMRQKLYVRLSLLAVADDANHRHAVRDVGIYQTFSNEFHHQSATVFANQRDLVRSFKPRTYVANHGFKIFGGDKIQIAMSNQLGASQPQHFCGGFIAVDDNADIDENNALRGRIGKFLQPLVTIADGLFGGVMPRDAA